MGHRTLFLGWITIGGLALALAVGCTFFKRLAGKDTIMLDQYEVLSMGVDIRKERKTICPLESVQMAVFVTAKDPEEAGKILELETWQGSPRGRHNDTLDFANFAFIPVNCCRVNVSVPCFQRITHCTFGFTANSRLKNPQAELRHFHTIIEDDCAINGQCHVCSSPCLTDRLNSS